MDRNKLAFQFAKILFSNPNIASKTPKQAIDYVFEVTDRFIRGIVDFDCRIEENKQRRKDDIERIQKIIDSQKKP